MSDTSPDALADTIEQLLGAANSRELDQLVARTPADAFQRALATCRGRNRARHQAAMSAAGPSTGTSGQNLSTYHEREAELDSLRDKAARPK